MIRFKMIDQITRWQLTLSAMWCDDEEEEDKDEEDEKEEEEEWIEYDERLEGEEEKSGDSWPKVKSWKRNLMEMGKMRNVKKWSEEIVSNIVTYDT